MEQLTGYAPQNDEQLLMALLSKKLKIKLGREELKSLDAIVKYWLMTQDLKNEDMHMQALMQAAIKLVETKLRPGVMQLKPTLSIKLDVMQAYVLREVLDVFNFLDSSFEMNLVNRIIAQIDRQL